MKRVFHIIVALAGLNLFMPQGARAQIHPAPVTADKLTQDPYRYTGLLVSEYSSGSAAVVNHPNIALSCAHVVFNEYSPFHPWLSDNIWYNTWHRGVFPAESSGQPLRGYLFFSGYSASALSRGLASTQTFSQDFTVHYSYEPLAQGAFAQAWGDGAAAARSGASKLITGYPAGLYPYGSPNAFLLHATGPFSSPFFRIFESYHEINGVSTGPGNSGGPLWVYQDTQALFAGVIVSGLEKSTGGGADIAGIRALDKRGLDLIDKSLAALTEGRIGGVPSEQNEGPDIKIYGNTGLIENGDFSPSRYDNTFFGAVAKSDEGLTRTFVIRNEGAQTLVLSPDHTVTLAGREKRLFKITRTPRADLASLQSTSFKIRFKSKRKGQHQASVRVVSNDPDASPYSFTIAAKVN